MLITVSTYYPATLITGFKAIKCLTLGTGGVCLAIATLTVVATAFVVTAGRFFTATRTGAGTITIGLTGTNIVQGTDNWAVFCFIAGCHGTAGAGVILAIGANGLGCTGFIARLVTVIRRTGCTRKLTDVCAVT